MSGRVLTLLVATSVLASCAQPRPSELPEDEPYLVVAKAAKIPWSQGWAIRWATHAWIDVKRGDEESWTRVELLSRWSGASARDLSASSARNDERWKGAVEILDVRTGQDAQRIGDELVALPESWEGDYRAFPGPNSNSFIAWAVRQVDRYGFEFDHNGLGKDYTGLFRIGETPSGSGVQVETPLVGAGVGVREGVELHLLQMTFGIDLFPPAIEIPVVPRIGW